MSTITPEITDYSAYKQLAENNAPTPTATSSSAMTNETVFLRVSVAATAKDVRVSFDPVTIEESRQTRQLNKSIRLGFTPPTSSTR